jgi:hypothetical protein
MSAEQSRVAVAWPMRLALGAVAGVWLLGCVWSFREQSAFAASRGFAFPHLLPLVIDGFAASMAGVSWAASLDARSAIPARLATVVAVAGSAASNGVWAWLRTGHDHVTVVLAVAVPIAANLAFEVLLVELRRQVQRRRGEPAPVALPIPRTVRLMLAPASTFFAWRAAVLDLTTLDGATPNQPSNAGAESSRVLTEAVVEPPESSLGEGHPVVPAREDRVTAPGRNQSDDELVARARRTLEHLVAPVGRRRLARELEVSEHTARMLLARLGTASANSDERDVSDGSDTSLIPRALHAVADGGERHE